MRVEVASDLKRSAAAFRDVVWPEIEGLFGGGEVVPVESVTAEAFSKDLDLMSGIDAWQVNRPDGFMRGIASRVQFGPTNWHTFTVRASRYSGAETELSKRMKAISEDRGFLYPHLTVQAYVNDGELLAAAVVKTKDLILEANRIWAGQLYSDEYGIRSPGNADFVWIDWDYLQAAGFEVKKRELAAA